MWSKGLRRIKENTKRIEDKNVFTFLKERLTELLGYDVNVFHSDVTLKKVYIYIYIKINGGECHDIICTMKVQNDELDMYDEILNKFYDLFIEEYAQIRHYDESVEHIYDIICGVKG